ncbi:MAG: hypothetical protein K8F92_08920 [Hyphomicrobium sp.]|uniref:hypothetical protein n=1 Tax=Hyphomicrobium sp. TaxID=82 RepID=UPI001320F8DC|nr:hypothetical protein [Hyphomicrobium sp.]KAB2943525.1 MAG: hypothetical protein F9K20_02265 [Hyphomicrobium sp.]MBZ0209764.1 hypothetical protein [Hyphomicrobium sp.]
MMKVSMVTAALVIGLAAPAIAGEGHCHEDMGTVDKAMASAKLNDADMATVKAARAKAEELHTAKKEEECEAALKDAQKLLGIKDAHSH